AKEELSNLKKEAMSTFQEVRGFIQELRPMMLDDLGLFPTVQRYIKTFREQSGVDVNISIKGQERRLEPYLEAMIFRAMQELMGNSVSHNKDHPVKIEINVELTLDEHWVKVSVTDNGKGFNPTTVNDMDNLGLKLIRERVDMLGGNIEIDAALGQGSRVSFQVPALEASSR
ncbi:MAG: ATP-binding protein, partial [Anaerolineaceae bacterium]|nr:ATP-binding protein [Anaerolineaceae bacterium]